MRRLAGIEHTDAEHTEHAPCFRLHEPGFRPCSSCLSMCPSTAALCPVPHRPLSKTVRFNVVRVIPAGAAAKKGFAGF